MPDYNYFPAKGLVLPVEKPKPAGLYDEYGPESSIPTACTIDGEEIDLTQCEQKTIGAPYRLYHLLVKGGMYEVKAWRGGKLEIGKLPTAADLGLSEPPRVIEVQGDGHTLDPIHSTPPTMDAEPPKRRGRKGKR